MNPLLNHTTLTGTTVATALVLAGSAFGQFSFDAAVNYAAGTRPSGIAAGDFDGDGDMDLATTIEGPDRIIVLLNDGSGAYSLGPASLLPASSSPQDLIAGRLDADGDVDLAVAVRDPQGSVIFMSNNGNGTFAQAGTFVVGDRPRGLAIADLEGDGDMDLAVANRNDNSASVLTNNGAGSFAVQTVSAGGETRATAFLDVDGDQDLDLAVTDHDGRRVVLFTNSGGSFAMSGALPVGGQVRPDGITAADVDNDGDADLAVATSDQTLGINQATIFVSTLTAFNGPFNYPTGGSNTSGIRAGDFDCDGLIDLATTNQDSNNVSLLRNTGAGVYGAAQIMAVGATPEAIATGDFDGDGDTELAVANRDSNNVSVLMNGTCAQGVPGDATGDGVVNFADILAVLAAWGDCPGCPADVNGDGVVDFADILIVLGNWTG